MSFKTLLVSALTFIASQPVATLATQKGLKEEKHNFIHDCYAGNNEAVLKEVTENPELLHVHGNKGDSCLGIAAMRRNLKLVIELTKRGADINFRNVLYPDHMPPIAWFILDHDPVVVETLLEYGADPNAVFHGIDSELQKSGEWFTCLDLIDYMLDHPPFNEHKGGYNEDVHTLPNLNDLHVAMYQMRAVVGLYGGLHHRKFGTDEL